MSPLLSNFDLRRPAPKALRIGAKSDPGAFSDLCFGPEPEGRKFFRRRSETFGARKSINHVIRSFVGNNKVNIRPTPIFNH